MTSSVRFVSWQPVLTDHQAYTLEALSQLSGLPVLSYVARLEDPQRQAQGWKDTQVRSIVRQQLPPRETLHQVYGRLCGHRQDIHLFGSPFEQPRLIGVLLLAAWMRLEVYLISEPYSPAADGYFDDRGAWRRRLKAWLRPCVYRCYGLLLGRRLKGVFTISALARNQYRRSGIPDAKLFPFGYFVPRLADLPTSPTRQVGSDIAAVRVVFVGSLIRRKGLDLLIEAVKCLADRGASVQLDVYGPDGPADFAFDGHSIRYCGVLPFGLAQTVIAGYELLVLPSRYDGWGVVVNEALCAGVPVVCSDRVGARVLVERFGAGRVFKAGESLSLRDALERIVSDRELLIAMRAGARDACAAIQPEVAARYLLAVVRKDPAARAATGSPWYSMPHASNS
jgi:glycosyltransferase involved in cell wall biosynthesis